jgi:tetratricopeptide (TPR) repeat protein
LIGVAALLLPLVLASSAQPADPDPEIKAALELVYQGHTDTALTRLRSVAAARPADPLASYALALALCWKVEERPDVDTLDRDLRAAALEAVERADAVLQHEPADVDARFARGAAYGALSRYHLFRQHRTDAARAAVRMRTDLDRARDIDPQHPDALFGLGLYDYYADVLPRAAKVVRFLARMPGGDRERGLASIEEAGRRSALHRTEARVQLYEIHAFYEDAPGRAMDEMDALRRQYPTHPLWALKAVEHLRARLGAYAESVAAGRAILARAARGEPNYAGRWVPALARLEMGHALVSDLRPADARPFLLAVVTDGLPGNPAGLARARLLLGASLEMDGDRAAALPHYRIAASGADGEWRDRARDAFSSPMPAERVRALGALGKARRQREGNHGGEAVSLAAEALRLWPESMEASLTLVDARLGSGEGEGARAVWPREDPRQVAETPWLRPWQWLLEAEKDDLEGRREDAVQQYKKVLKDPFRRPDLKRRAEAGIKAPFHSRPARVTPHAPRAFSTALSTT